MEVFNRLSRGKRVALAVIGVIALVGGGAAIAAWLAGGTGSGAARATSALDLVVTSGTTTGQLFPGGAGDVVVSIQNPNGYPVSVTGVSSTGSITDSSGPAACDAATGVSYVDAEAENDLPTTINANSTKTVTFTNAASMTNASDTTCQGATFTIPITVTGASAATP